MSDDVDDAVDAGHADHLGYSVKRLYHLMGQHFNEVLRPYGVARSQWYMLLHISRSAGLPQRELQDVLQVESATLTAAINVLERKGWVTRRQSRTDRRVKELALTPAGRELWESLPDPIVTIRTRMLDGISAEEEKTARTVLDRAIGNLARASNE
jgi:MarR family transcriptional regulator, lower aerobic nicotinate degradation pathway regulator